MPARGLIHICGSDVRCAFRRMLVRNSQVQSFTYLRRIDNWPASDRKNASHRGERKSLMPAFAWGFQEQG
ncbi:hypothetical protein ACVIHI_008364 [Bradyrhizobium sp. USDA 4524]|nr:hypothetical protein [Bradyrhizobium sp. USDA 4538]MCP1899277.1 hypothetical protein [Bradyrhizobium sp. USDA 4537]MCP1986611.1 hypothetical protein [Bradyrhizobium sp. USDA 4539]